MLSFGERILWRRAQEYIQTYRPTLIGIVGSSGAALAKAAVEIAIGGERHLLPTLYHSSARRAVAQHILGMTNLDPRSSWFRLLTQSLVREVSQEEPDTCVLELPISRPGDMDWLATHVPFQVGIITDVGTRHTELFGSAEAVAHEYTSLLATLPPQGYAIVNADDERVAIAATHTKARVITFGTDTTAQVRLQHLQRLPHHGLAGEIRIEGQPYEIHLQHIIGRHQVVYALAGVATAWALGIKVEEAVQRLQKFAPPPGHLFLVVGEGNVRLLDASVCTTPQSMMAALETLRALKATRRIAILGDIVGLGGETYRAHKRIGKFAGEVAHVVMAVGQHMRLAGAEALAVGSDVHHFDKSEDAGKWLSDFVTPNDLILIAGSPDMGMEKIVERLRGT